MTATLTSSSWASLGLVATVVLAATALLSRAQGRRLERRLAAELGRRRNEHHPSPSRADREPAAPDADLRITLEQLLEQRDRLLEEFQVVQSHIRTLKRETDRRRFGAADGRAEVITLHGVEQERPIT